MKNFLDLVKGVVTICLFVLLFIVPFCDKAVSANHVAILSYSIDNSVMVASN